MLACPHTGEEANEKGAHGAPFDLSIATGRKDRHPTT